MSDDNTRKSQSTLNGVGTRKDLIKRQMEVIQRLRESVQSEIKAQDEVEKIVGPARSEAERAWDLLLKTEPSLARLKDSKHVEPSVVELNLSKAAENTSEKAKRLEAAVEYLREALVSVAGKRNVFIFATIGLILIISFYLTYTPSVPITVAQGKPPYNTIQIPVNEPAATPTTTQATIPVDTSTPTPTSTPAPAPISIEVPASEHQPKEQFEEKTTINEASIRGSTPKYYIQSINARVAQIGFFESDYNPTNSLHRNQYRFNFSKQTSRYIFWEVILDYPPPVGRIDYEIESKWYDMNNNMIYSNTSNFYINPRTWQSYNYDGYGWRTPGKFPFGKYRVELYSQGEKIAVSIFEIY